MYALKDSDGDLNLAVFWSELFWEVRPVQGCAERYAKGLPWVPAAYSVQFELVQLAVLDDGCMQAVLNT